MTKNLISALEQADIKPTTRVNLSSDKEFMERAEKYAEIIEKFSSYKENLERNSRTDMVFKIGNHSWYLLN